MPERADIDASFVADAWPWISSVVLDGQVVLFDETTGRVHLLNDSGSIAWQLFDGRTPLGEIAATIAEAAGAEPHAVLYDIVAFTRVMADLGSLVGFDARAVDPPVP